MARFEVRVLVNVEQTNAWEARKTVEEGMRSAGFERWRVAALRSYDMPRARRRMRRAIERRDQFVGGSILVGAVIMWWLWFWMNLL